MDDFNNIRTQLNNARNSKSDSKQRLFLANERLKKYNKELNSLLRKYDSTNPSHASQRKRLLSEIKEQQGAIGTLQQELNRFTELEASVYKKFFPLADPRELISNLNDEYPILLFPVRIETRFKNITVDNETVNELWVRIYPDDCVINTFESTPSEMELDNTEFYWSALWQAGKVGDQERAAWRTLVNSHGSGRAKWLIQRYRPENETDAPEKPNSEDVILVITVYTMPSAVEQPEILKYWENVWKANGDVQKQTDAFNQLASQIGAARAKEVAENLVPDNIDAIPGSSKSVDEVTVKAVFLKFPDPSTVDSKEDSWSQAPRVENMPERFVVMGYSGTTQNFQVIGQPVPSPLYTGPDPSLPDEEKLQKKEGKLQFDKGMRWMVDFDEAIRIGMGFRIRLTPEQAKRGFDKIVVLGVRMSANPDEGAEILGSLITDHSNSRKGFEMLAQGTVTNNTDNDESGFLSSDDPDQSFDELKKEFNFEHKDIQYEKSDGQLFAEYLGLHPNIIQKITGSGRFDQRNAWAMNTALWPATMGYMMESMMEPVFTENDVEATREFFTKYVSGRGVIPAVRIGEQPYGILPISKFDALSWFMIRRGSEDNIPRITGQATNFSFYIEKLYAVLLKIDKDWNQYLSKISYVGKSGDAHQLLLDIVGLNPDSVEFYRRYAESIESLYNRMLFFIAWFGGNKNIIPGGYLSSGVDLLRSFGLTVDEKPEILEKFFTKNQHRMNPFLIDDRPVSETELIRNYMPDGEPERNYIQWLIDAVNVSHNELRKQAGFKDDKRPTALLYLMLHHALDLSYVDVSLKLHLQAEIMNTTQVKQAKVDPVFLHIQEQNKTTESKWQYLYKTEAKITNNQNMQIGEYIPTLFGKMESPAAYMSYMIGALGYLKDASTGELERLIEEHIDCCSYRLDAWKNGFMRAQIQRMRPLNEGDDGEKIRRRGVYLGAFGYLEDIRPEFKTLTPVKLSEELKKYFDDPNQPELVKNDKNQGYVLAPSLNHAVTAAVLRNGYIENASQSNPDTLKVNLSSERVRKALSIIEGIRGGQSLGALLGYHLEKGMHDHHPGVELDYFIYQLRKAFPLKANKMRSTHDENAAAEEIDARNVVDGLALITHIQRTNNTSYPFGKSIEDVDNEDQRTAINEEVNQIMDMNDAIADVAIAESVHQIVVGNYERGVATLDTFSKGNFPPIPDVIQTPRSGFNITHRVGIQFEPGLNHTVSPITGLSITPRAMAEPAVNKWLAGILPDPSNVVCELEYYDFTADAFQTVTVSQKKLGLQPIDLIYFLDVQDSKAMSILDDKITNWILSTVNLRPDAEIRINYTKSVPGKISFFELNPLVESLRAIVLRSNMLQANDVARPTEIKLRQKPVFNIYDSRLTDALSNGNNALGNLKTHLTNLGLLLDDTEANRDTIISQIDTWIINLNAEARKLSEFSPEMAGTGFTYGWKFDTYSALITKIQKLVDRWEERLTKYDDYITDFNNAANREEEEKAVQGAQRQVSTTAIYPLPANLNQYVSNELATLHTNFVNKLNTFKASLNLNTNTLFTLLNDIRPKLDYSLFDNEKTSVTDIEDRIVLFAGDMYNAYNKLHTELTKRFTNAQDLLNALPGLADPIKKMDNFQHGAKLIFGDDFVVVPEFEIFGDMADEWQNAFNDKTQLLSYSESSPDKFPLEDWMHGVARVREKIKHWENVVFLTEAFESASLELHPLQLPYKNNDNWVAVDFPDNYEIDSDKILYTALYPAPFDKTNAQCGLLVDEWTEVIPSKEETAGVTFHYDRPNSEPPQVWLMAMPTDFRGAWQWNELVDSVIDTFEQAKKRAIEPDHIDESSYAWFLPAVISSFTSHRISPSLNLALAETKLFNFINIQVND